MRIIGHLDMDAFFAAVEERDRPRLKGKPIVVGSDPKDGRGRGVVSTANYKARAYGIHSAMPITKAWELAEKAKREGQSAVVFIGGSYRHYSEVSERIFEIISKFIPVFEQTSIDEGYLDLSFTRSYESAKSLANKIKKEIQNREWLTCSVGIGPNKLIAKIASDSKKPEGLTVVGNEDERACALLVEAFLEPLPIRKIPGLGPKTETILSSKGIKTVSDLKKLNKSETQSLFGKWGLDLYAKARGIDNSPIGVFEAAKSIGEQETFEKDTLDPNFVMGRMKALTSAVFRRFQKSGFREFRAVTITVRFAGFETRNRSHTFPEPKSDLLSLEFEAQRLLSPFFDKRENPNRKPVRLVGIRIEKLN